MTIEQERLTPTQEDREAAAIELDVFLAAYPDEPDTGLVERVDGDDLLTWGTLRTLLAALKSPPIGGDGELEVSPEAIRADAIASRAQMIAAYTGPVVSFNVDDDRYYLASCDACGWVGSTELCPHDEEDVICPRCFTSGADCGKVAEKIASAPTTSGDVGKLCEQDALRGKLGEILTMAFDVEGDDPRVENAVVALLTQMEAREQALREAVSAVLPSAAGAANQPDMKVIPFYITLGELRGLRALLTGASK